MGISCAIYDQLELAAMRHQIVSITLNNNLNKEIQIECVIKDLYVKQGKEYLMTTHNEEYELSGLISIEVQSKTQ